MYHVFGFMCWLLLVDWVQNEYGAWEVFLPNNADGSPPIHHGSRVKVCSMGTWLYVFIDIV